MMIDLNIKFQAERRRAERRALQARLTRRYNMLLVTVWAVIATARLLERS